MNTYSIFKLATGLFTGMKLTIAPKLLPTNVPIGCAAVGGQYDALSQRVDLAAYAERQTAIDAAQQSLDAALATLAALDAEQAAQPPLPLDATDEERAERIVIDAAREAARTVAQGERAAARAELLEAEATSVVIDYQPPAPADTEDATQEWDDATKRWIAKRTLIANKKARKAPIQIEIEALEATQHDPARTMLIKIGAGASYAAALAKLKVIDDAIGLLKDKIASITACTTQAELDAIP